MSAAIRQGRLLLAALACCANVGWASAGPDQASAAIAQAKVHLVPALQERIESAQVSYRTPHRPFLPFAPDPCAARPGAACEIGAITFRLQEDPPAPGICLREFVTITPDSLQAPLPPASRGDLRVALGTDCAALSSGGYARLESGSRKEAAAHLLLWLKAQQEIAQSSDDSSGVQIDCRETAAAGRPPETCGADARAAFARLPLASIDNIGTIPWNPDGERWQSGQHWTLSIAPGAGSLVCRLSVHRNAGGQDRILMSWEPPAPF